MQTHGLGPRDFVLLVRQKASDYAAVLEPAFRVAGLALRNEAGTVGAVMLQELLAEEASKLLICVLRLAMTPRAGRYWSACQDALADLRGVARDDEALLARLARDIDAFATALHRDHPTPSPDAAAARKLVDRILDFIGRGPLVGTHPSYGQGDWFAKVIDSAARHLRACSAGMADWTATLDAYEGLDAMPLMTIEIKPTSPRCHSAVEVEVTADRSAGLADAVVGPQIDWFSRRVLSWRVSISMEAAFCVETLEDALARHSKPEIFNTGAFPAFCKADRVAAPARWRSDIELTFATIAVT